MGYALTEYVRWKRRKEEEKWMRYREKSKKSDKELEAEFEKYRKRFELLDKFYFYLLEEGVTFHICP